MDKGQLRYDWNVIVRAYKQIGKDPIFCLSLFVLTILFLTSCFLLLSYEPVDHWQETEFVLDHTVYRHTGRSGYVLDVYTTDGRQYVINEREAVIRDQLESGSTYWAVYSDDFFCDTIQSLRDGGREYLNLSDRQIHSKVSFLVFYVSLVVSVFFLLLFNGIYAVRAVKCERRRMRSFSAKKRKR